MILKLMTKAILPCMKGILTTSFLIVLLNICFLANAQNAAVLLYNTELVIENGKLEERVRIIIQINNREGEDYHNFNINYTEGDKIKNLKAWIADSDNQEIKKLNPKDVKDRNRFDYTTFHSDNFIKYFSLTHGEYPYKLHIEYTHQYEKFLYIAHWSPGLYIYIPSYFSKLKLTVPNDYKISIKSFDIPAPEITNTEDKIMYSWESSYLSPFENEKLAPDKQDLYPHLVIVPEKFNYGLAGEFTSWQIYGNWQYRMLEGLDHLTDQEISIIHQLTDTIENDLDKAKTLYHYLQDNTRYINVSIDVGGLKPYPASYVAINKYGDCKALTNYMMTILKEVGIESYYSKIYSGNIPITLDKDFPSQQFNHVILMALINNDTVWLENTSDIAPFGYLGTFTQNREAFVIKKDSSYFIKTPALDSNMVFESYATHLRFDEELDCNVNAQLILYGDNFENVSFYSKQLSEQEQKKQLRGYIKFKNFEITDWEIHQSNRDLPFVTVDLKYTASHFLKSQSQFIYGAIPPLNTEIFNLKKERKWPLVLMYPIHISDSLFIGYNSTMEPTLRDDIHLKSDFGHYSFEYKITKSGELLIIRKLLIYQGKYENEVYDAFKAFIDQIKNIESKNPIVLNKIL